MNLTQRKLAPMVALLSQGHTLAQVAERLDIHENSVKYGLKAAKELLGLDANAARSDVIAAAITQGWITDRRKKGREEIREFLAYLEDDLPAGPIGDGILGYLEQRFASWQPDILGEKRAA